MNVYLLLALQSFVSMLLFGGAYIQRKGGEDRHLLASAFVLQVLAFVLLLWSL
jgi:hypothetical protein